MKRSHTEQRERLERALMQVRQRQIPPHLSQRWVKGVMNEIRGRHPHQPLLFDSPWVIWRAVSVIILVTVLLVGMSLRRHVPDETDPSALLAEVFEDSPFIVGAP